MQKSSIGMADHSALSAFQAGNAVLMNIEVHLAAAHMLADGAVNCMKL